MKTIGYIPLYYGAEYLDASVRSILPHVDKLVVVYTDKPSQGHSTSVPCPESEEMLKGIVDNIDSDKIVWVKERFTHEGAHREYILNHALGYDLVLTVDADEVLGDNVQQALEYAYNSSSRRFGVRGFINFWRNFNNVCLDGFQPHRITNLNNKDGQDAVDMTIYHFGCCQSMEITKFKWETSGHKDELRPNWIEDVYLTWTEENQIPNLHAVANGLWNSVPFDKTTLPQILKDHPNYNKEYV